MSHGSGGLSNGSARGRALLDDPRRPREEGRRQAQPEGPRAPEDAEPMDAARLGESGGRGGENRSPGRPEERPAGDQIFQEPIQSMSFAPAGFMPCLVETTSIGSMVTKS